MYSVCCTTSYQRTINKTANLVLWGGFLVLIPPVDRIIWHSLESQLRCYSDPYFKGETCLCNSSNDPERSQWVCLCVCFCLCVHNGPRVEPSAPLGREPSEGKHAIHRDLSNCTTRRKGPIFLCSQQHTHTHRHTHTETQSRFDGENGNKRLYAHECYHFIPLLQMLQGSLGKSRSNKFTLLN